MVRIRPRQDLLNRQRRQGALVTHATALGQQSGQRRAPPKAAEPDAQGAVDTPPRIFRALDGPAIQVRPFTGALEMGVGPGQYLVDGKFGTAPGSAS